MRRLAREHRATEKPFDPTKRGTWQGSSRDLVVNPRRKIRDDVEETFLVIEEERTNSYGNPTEWVVVNPLDYPRGKHAASGSLFAFRLGAYGDSCYLVWALPDHYDSAITELADFCEKYAPGHLTSEEDVGKLMEEAREDDGEMDDEEAYEKATADLTYTEAGYFTSYELHVDELVDGPLYEATDEACHEEYEREYGEEAPGGQRKNGSMSKRTGWSSGYLSDAARADVHGRVAIVRDDHMGYWKALYNREDAEDACDDFAATASYPDGDVLLTCEIFDSPDEEDSSETYRATYTFPR